MTKHTQTHTWIYILMDVGSFSFKLKRGTPPISACGAHNWDNFFTNWLCYKLEERTKIFTRQDGFNKRYYELHYGNCNISKAQINIRNKSHDISAHQPQLHSFFDPPLFNHLQAKYFTEMQY